MEKLLRGRQRQCSNCLRLEAIIVELRERIRQLEEQVARLSKNSSNSSKPPSSDIVKAPSATAPPHRSGKKRKIGAQPGHPKHERTSFPPEKIDEFKRYELDCCPQCSGNVVALNIVLDRIQQAELVESPIRIVEHQVMGYECLDCGEIVKAPLPAQVQAGNLLGPRLTAFVTYLKAKCHSSYSTIQDFFGDVFSFPIARGTLTKTIAKVCQMLEVPYQELLLRMPEEASLHVDETGHRENADKFWTWCFRAVSYVVFKISRSRGSDVLIATLGMEFEGILGCDYFSAYRKYMREFNVNVQFCLAHLIRDVKFLLSLPNPATRRYGERLLEAIRQMFHVIHQRETLKPEPFQRKLAVSREDVLAAGLTRVPKTLETQNMAKRFREHGESYFRFMTTPGIEPTNNLAEQAIRFVVIDRHITQGTRSEVGRMCAERLWTVIGTCALQKRSAFEYLLDVVKAAWTGTAIPSLLARPP